MIKLRYADINLTTGEIKDYPVSDKYQELYLGGKSLGARIYMMKCLPIPIHYQQKPLS